jgi:hypothetical protein
MDEEMAQIWLTYDELGELFDRSPARMRQHVIECDWTRRRSRDGLTRVKLPPNVMWHFISVMADHCNEMRASFAQRTNNTGDKSQPFFRPQPLLAHRQAFREAGI